MKRPFNHDGIGLRTEGTQEGVHERPDVGDHVPQVHGHTTARSRRILDGYGRANTSTHLHLVGWGLREYPKNLCAVVEDFAKSGWVESRSGRYFHFAEAKTQPPQMDCAVFVGVGEVVEVEQGTVDWQTPIRIRLQGLDECLWFIADVLDAPGTVISEFSGAGEDREHGLVMLDSIEIERELKDALVEGGSQVVDNLTQEDREVERDRRVELEVVNVLREIRLYLTANAIGERFGVDVRRHGVGEDLRLVIRADDFESNGRHSREVRLTDD